MGVGFLALLVWDNGNRDPNKTDVEASVRQELLLVEGDHVHVRGLRFRYAANMAQHGAIVLAGRHDTMEDCVIEAMNASGATFTGEDTVVRRCVFRDNGQIGFGASRAHRLLFTECLVENNNTKGFDRGWEAGGDKLVLGSQKPDTRIVLAFRHPLVPVAGWFLAGNAVPRRCPVGLRRRRPGEPSLPDRRPMCGAGSLGRGWRRRLAAARPSLVGGRGCVSRGAGITALRRGQAGASDLVTSVAARSLNPRPREGATPGSFIAELGCPVSIRAPVRGRLPMHDDVRTLNPFQSAPP